MLKSSSKRDPFAYESIRMKAHMDSIFGKKPLPKFLRRLFARRAIHYAWLQGHTGSFILPVMERLPVKMDGAVIMKYERKGSFHRVSFSNGH